MHHPRRRSPRQRALTALLAALTAAAVAWAPPTLAQPTLAQTTPASVDDILNQTAEIRGLALLTPVPISSMDRGQLQVLLTRELESDDAIREYRTSGILLEMLGLIPAGFDLRLYQIDLLREQVGGLYGRERRELYVIGDGGPLGALDKTILAHEVTHALQDQHFGLDRLLPAQGVSADGLMAATALLEGDALLTMNQWGLRFLTPAEKLSLDEPRPTSGALADAPLIVRAELEFPYLEGHFFAIQLHQDGGGFEAVNQALADPPRSTEQVIHPEKYLAREAPVSVELPPLDEALGDGWQLLRTDVLGELVLRVLIQDTLGWPEAEAAATGWGGDAYAVLEDDAGRRLVVLETAWDTEPDAAEFYNAYVRAVTGRFGSALRSVQSEPSRIRWSAPGLLIQALKTDDRVRLIFGPDAPTLDAIDAQFAGRAPAASPVTVPSAAPTPVPSTPVPSTPVPSTDLAPVPTLAPATDPTSTPAFSPNGPSGDPTPEVATPVPTPDTTQPEPSPPDPFTDPLPTGVPGPSIDAPLDEDSVPTDE